MPGAAGAGSGGERVLRFVDGMLCWAAGALVVALLLVVTAGIVTRAANQPLSWTDEAAGYLMVWLAAFGWMLATRRGAHIRIGFFADFLPTRARGALDGLLKALTSVFGAMVVLTSLLQIRANLDIEAMALPISTAWLYLPLVPAGAVTVVQALAEMAAAGRRERTPAHQVGP
jgi:TRAP-type C4-dicarboxylate transport system permease small subunit